MIAIMPGVGTGLDRMIQQKLQAWAVALTIGSAVLGNGCAATSRTPTATQRQRLGADVDLARAFLSLAEVEPVPSRPVRPPALKPLSDRASRQITKAHRLVSDQRYTEAAIELERALRYDPNHPSVHRTLALLHWQAGNLGRSRVHVEMALDGNPDDVVAHYVHGRTLIAESNLTAAAMAFRTALLCSDATRVGQIAVLCHFYLARVLADDGYLQAAVDEYTAFDTASASFADSATEPDLIEVLADHGSQTGRLRSQLLETLGRFSEAADAMNSVWQSSPDDVAQGRRYATLLLQAGRAEEALKIARAIPSYQDDVITLLYDIYEKLGHPERIVDDLQSKREEHPNDASLTLNLANVLLRLGRKEEARKQLQAVLAEEPGSSEIRRRLIDLSIEQHAWTQAVEAAAKGIELDVDSVELFRAPILSLSDQSEAVRAIAHVDRPSDSTAVRYLRGLLAMGSGDLDRAEPMLLKAYEQDPQFLPARVAIAQVYLRSYRYEDARAIVARRDEAVPEDAVLEWLLGHVHDRLDHFEDAERHWRAAIQLNRKDLRPQMDLARLYDTARKRLQAQRQLRVVLEKDPRHEEARELLAATYLADRKPDVAIEQYEALRAYSSSPLVRARCEAMLSQLQHPEIEAYRKVLTDAIAKHGGDADTWIALAESYDSNADPQPRYEAFLHAAAHEPDNERAAEGLIRAAKHLLDFEGAAERLRGLLPRRPNRERWRLELIDLYWIIHDFEAALLLSEEPLEREPAESRQVRLYRRTVVETLHLLNRGEEALRRVQRWVEESPDDRHWTQLLANLYLREDRPLDALPILESIYLEDRKWNSLAAVLASLEQAERFDRAEQYLLDWLDDDPESDAAIDRLAGVLTSAKRFDQARALVKNRLLHTLAREFFQTRLVDVLSRGKYFEECIDFIESLLDEVNGLMGKLRENQGQPPEVDESDLEQVIRLPNEPFVVQRLQQRVVTLRITLATILIFAEEYDTAEDHLNGWLEDARDPGDRFEYLRRLAFARQRQGDDIEANETLARALALEPGHLGLNNDVAYGWIDQGIRLEQAEEMIRRALVRNPRRGAYLDTYGWLQYKLGFLNKAKIYLLRAKGLEGETDPVVADHLGDACWRMGEKDEAIKYWREAMDAARERADQPSPTADEKRVRESTQQKIDAANEGKEPSVAPLAEVQPGEPPSVLDLPP